MEQICVECGNDLATEGQVVCSECLETLSDLELHQLTTFAGT